MSSKANLKYISIPSVFTFVVSLVCGSTPDNLYDDYDITESRNMYYISPPDSTAKDTSKTLPYPIKDRRPYEHALKRHFFDLSDPSNVKSKYVLDSSGNNYNYTSKVGNTDYRLPATETIKQLLNDENTRQTEAYFRQRSQAQNFTTGSGLIPPLHVGPKIFDKIFGSGVIDIRPRGTAEVIFAGNFNTVRNPQLSPQQQTTGQFDFRQKIQLNVQGSIGDRMKINLNYDTEAAFDFENQVKLDYAGKEDDIIKKIEVGNVTLPLNSSLIRGSTSLFGVKTTLQFGRLTMTTVIAQDRGKTTETTMTGGAQTSTFDIQCDNYDMNRHYFLAQFFRDNYDKWLSNLPINNSPIVINRVEVWVTNRTAAFDNSRDVIGFSDMGENSHLDNQYWKAPGSTADLPGNFTNSLYPYLIGQNPIDKDTASLRSTYNIQNQLSKDQNTTKLQPISQYQIINYARQLSPTEFTFNPLMGYISLNQQLNNDDVLCVAYEYIYNGRIYRVGEFSTGANSVPPNTNNPNVLFLKMLKGPSQRPDLPMWKLMMKNIYSLGTYNVQQKDFKLNIIYADDPSGAKLNYIPAQGEPQLVGIPLLSVMNLDNMNAQQQRVPDGVFDFIEGVTIQSQQGRIIFPVLEPFGSYLSTKFKDPVKARYYSFYELYDSTLFAALQLPQYDKFYLRGTYSGSSNSEISVGQTNIPRGAVKVTANGALLTENQDYTVDYSLGRVKIINTGLLNSGAVIKVSAESNSLFSVQQKSMLGSRFDYKYSNNLILGGTLLYLTERPLTPKVNIGDEPISNLMIGLDGTYKRDSRFLTKMIDQIPFLETKAPSNIIVSGEYARLIPGSNSALAQNGTSYLDDFEGSETPFDLRFGNNWVLASTPQFQNDLFPESVYSNKLDYGFKRANLAWYSISTTFTNEGDPFQPAHIKADPDQLSNHCVRSVQISEVYPNRQIQAGMPTILPTFDLAFYPKERGPYNYTVQNLNADGTLKNLPNSPTWGGIMRKIDQSDFEAANIDYIEIWMMDPYLCNNPNNSGQLYINLGNISEDVLRDSRKSAENGMPKDPNVQYADTTSWGRVPHIPVINFAFDADPASRVQQDVGLDGLGDNIGEKVFFDTSYVEKVKGLFGAGSQAYANAASDPSNDDYHFYLGNDYDAAKTSILDRYKKYNRHEGNSPIYDPTQPYSTAATNIPDCEDINRDFTLNEIEEYYQYRIDIGKTKMVVGQNFVTDSATGPLLVPLPNGTTPVVTWYQLKIPVREFQQRIGEIIDFKSIRFMRAFMRGFQDNMILRFAAINLVRADWRKYLGNLEAGMENKPADPENNTTFVVSTVNIEKNGNRTPIVYTVPPGIARTIDFSSPTPIQQNEQSLSIKICNLVDGDARGVFKNTKVDLRQYKTLRMFLHAEGNQLKDGELTAFIRLGTDLTNNYYEYEMPLKVTLPNHNDPSEVWPTDNEMAITLEDFINAKIARTNANYPFTVPFTSQNGNAKITVIGLPDLSNVRIMMLGVRNPKRIPGGTDDGLPKCGEIWYDELRMTDFNNTGGWAANGRIQTKLADFGNIQLTGSITSVGFGGIDQKLAQRSMNDQYMYDLQSSFELGKFLPKTSGISIPMFFSYGNTLIRPLYDPLNQDTKIAKELANITDPNKRAIISQSSDDYSTRRGFNLTNVRKNRIGNKRKAQFYDIENFSATYSFVENYQRNQTLDYYILQTYSGQILYNYNFVSKPFEPFKNIVTSKYLALIKDFNLSYMPSSWGFRMETQKRYGETDYRNNDNTLTVIQPVYDKNFIQKRYYELGYSITKNLKFDYNATVQSSVDEPFGKIDANNTQKKDSVWNNFWKGGRTTQFDQTARINYNVPINKIPFLEFIDQSTYSYSANYEWKAAPPAADSLGNTITNSRVQTANISFNFIKLYNKIPYLYQINNPQARVTKAKKKDEKNKTPTKGKKPLKDEIPEPIEPPKKPPALVYALKLLMMIKNVSLTGNQSEGTTLPGFNPKPNNFGENNALGAPGFGFIAGMQDGNFRNIAAQNGWLSNDPRISNFYMQDFRQQISGRVLLEPISDFRIELTVSKNQTLSSSSLFKFDTITKNHHDVTPLTQSGSYSISYNIFASTFSPENSSGISNVFQQFENNRIIIASRLAQQNSSSKPSHGIDENGFPIGYSRNSQDVLIPAFLAAYSGTNPNKIGLTAFPAIPIPNWKISYNGLSKIEAIKEYATNISITNMYSSTYNVGNYSSTWDTTGSQSSITNDYTPQFQIKTFSIVEKWGPFIGIDVTFIKNISASFKYNRDRILNFSMSSLQLAEQDGSEFVFGAGYRTSKLVLPFNIGGRKRVLNNDINFRLDISIRSQETKVRNLDIPSDIPVSGQNVYTLKPNIDYMINAKLKLRIYYQRTSTTPYTSNQYQTIIQSGGFSIQYTIQ